MTGDMRSVPVPDSERKIKRTVSTEINAALVGVKGLKGEKGDIGRGYTPGISGMDTSGFPAGFVEGPQGTPGRKVSIYPLVSAKC